MTLGNLYDYGNFPGSRSVGFSGPHTDQLVPPIGMVGDFETSIMSNDGYIAECKIRRGEVIAFSRSLFPRGYY